MANRCEKIFGFISIGELAAPVLGGVVYKKSGYGGVFGLGFGILAIDFIMRLLLIEKKVATRYGLVDEHRFDGPSEEHQEDEETEEDPLIKKEEGDRYKIPENQPRLIRSVPILYCLKDPRLLTAQLVALSQATLLATFDATVPTVAQDYFGFNSLKAGLLFIALILPYLLLGPVAGWLVDRYGPKPAAVFGYGFLAPVLILLRLVRPGGTSQVVIFCALLALCGLGFAGIGAPSIVEAATVVSKYEKANEGFFGENGPYAQLYGINSMVFSLGLTIGPLISGSLKDAVGYGNMNLFVAALCLFTSIMSFIFIGGKPRFLRKSKSTE